MPADELSRDVAVVLAVKDLAAAKSRLAGRFAHDDDRRALVAAMFADTLAAVRAAGLSRVIVVSPDRDVHARVADFGALAVDEPARGGLNAALSHGADVARDRWASSRIVFLQADLPALSAESLDGAIDDAAAHPAAFVADRAGLGTVLLSIAADSGFAPAFGNGSAQAHRVRGAVELRPAADRWPDLRADVDTPDDLRHVALLGVGPHTRTVLDRPRPPRARARTGPMGNNG
ncbi:MAG: 2-phospho-L-lactate guanylyltransferase [Gordonia sp. (in: high G+C Gram-positive bacteria)]